MGRSSKKCLLVSQKSIVENDKDRYPPSKRSKECKAEIPPVMAAVSENGKYMLHNAFKFVPKSMLPSK